MTKKETKAKKKEICRFYQKGACNRKDCKFQHIKTEVKAQEVCKFYLKGKCKYGDKCWFSHEGVPDENVEKVFGLLRKHLSAASFDYDDGVYDELACQGIKPWEDSALDALNVLYDF
jgi:hypothetical protein